MVQFKIPKSNLIDPLGVGDRVMGVIKKISQKPLKKQKLGLALGAGGLWGIVHIGVLKVLEEKDIQIDYIAGTSIGAIIGAIYSLNPDTKEIEKKVLSLTKKDLINFFDLTLPRFSLISGNNIKKFIYEIVGNKSFSDTKIPLKIIATDLESGEEVILSEGKLIDAIMASISIPGIFPPVKYKNSLLVDGALVNATPVNIIKDMGADVVLGVDLNTVIDEDFEKPNLFQVLIRSYEILKKHSALSNINLDDEKILIIRPNIKKLGSFNFYDIKKFVKEGERIARQVLPKINMLIGEQ